MTVHSSIEASTWRELTHHRPMAALIDIDQGPFACNLETAWHPPTALRDACEYLQRAHVQVVLVSGARRDAIEQLRDQLPAVWWYVEHGAWRYANSMWAGHAPRRELDALGAVVAELATPSVKVSRTTIGLSATWTDSDGALAAALSSAFAVWLVANPSFRLYVSPQRLEVRLASASKGDVVPWVRQRAPEARCVLVAIDARADGPRDLALSDVDAPALLRSLADLRASAIPATPLAPQRPRGRR